MVAVIVRNQYIGDIFRADAKVIDRACKARTCARIEYGDRIATEHDEVKYGGIDAVIGG